MCSTIVSRTCNPALPLAACFICLLLITAQSYAQSALPLSHVSYRDNVSSSAPLNTSLDRFDSRGTIFEQLWGDVTYLAGQKDFYIVVGGIAAAPSICGDAFRQESPEITELWGPSTFADGFFELGESYGQAIVPVSGAVILWAGGKLTHNKALGSFSSDLLRVHAINGLLTTAMKGAVNRKRPNGAPYSFPSGHTSVSFATAGVVYRHLGKAWGIPAFALASYVGLSRLQENKHYLSDVVAGAILGTYVSLKLTGQRNEGRSVYVSPYTSHSSAGLSLSLRF